MSMMAQIVGGLLVTAAIIGALAVIGKTVVYLAGLARKLNMWLDDWAGEPPRPGFPEGRPGVLDRIARIETRLGAVEAQMLPNGGGSLRDVVDRTAAAVSDRSPQPDGVGERSAIVQP